MGRIDIERPMAGKESIGDGPLPSQGHMRSELG